MSTLLIRHWLKLHIALFKIVVAKMQHIKVLYRVVLNFHFDLTKKKINFEFSLSNSDCRNLSFIENYFYLLDYSYVIKRMDFFKLKKLPDQLINKLSCIN